MIERLEEECWGLDSTLANYILPRLLYFKNWCIRYGIPQDLEEEEWEEILDEMVWAFTFVTKDYPSTTDHVVEDYDFESAEPNEEGLIPVTIHVIYKEGKSEEDYKAAFRKDVSNRHRCQRGLNLFAKHYMSLWN